MFRVQFVPTNRQFLDKIKSFARDNNYIQYDVLSDLYLQADLYAYNSSGILVVDDADTVVAYNICLWDRSIGTGAEPIVSLELDIPHFARTLNFDQILEIIKLVNRPIDWKVPKDLYPDGYCNVDDFGTFLLPLPASVEEYIKSLYKKDRTEYRKYIKYNITFEHVSLDSILQEISIEDLCSNYRQQIGKQASDCTDYRVKLLFNPKSSVSKDLYFLKVYADGEHIGYNVGSIVSITPEEFIYTDGMFICRDPNTYYKKGFYFAIIYSLITYFIEQKNVRYYNLMGGIKVKSKFMPEDYVPEKLVSLGLCNMKDDGTLDSKITPDVYTNPSFFGDNYYASKGFTYIKCTNGAEVEFIMVGAVALDIVMKKGDWSDQVLKEIIDYLCKVFTPEMNYKNISFYSACVMHPTYSEDYTS